ncbi:MAG: 3-hydroxyacyl-ACP dehydratase FabZ [Deltaproteobacteria bacterium]
MIISRDEIEKFLPHRDPFLFVDCVLELEAEKSITAQKTFSASADFLRGHFPGNPIVPGVVIIEALAQAACVLLFASNSDFSGKTPALVGLDKSRFKKPVLPGDEVRLRVEITKKRSRMWWIKGEAFVGEALVAETEIVASLF